LLRQFLARSIRSGEFDSAIWQAVEGTSDRSARHVAECLYLLYDDCIDHVAILSRPRWSFCQRLLLILESEAEIDILRRSRSSPRQGLAALALVAFSAGVWWLGFGWQLILLAAPFGLFSMVLAQFFPMRDGPTVRPAPHLAPFSSKREILHVRRQTPAFRKLRYPCEVGRGYLRGPVRERLALVPSRLLWLVASPLVLLIQCFPDSEVSTSVSMHKQSFPPLVRAVTGTA
jgi:hypothetical protein